MRAGLPASLPRARRVFKVEVKDGMFPSSSFPGFPHSSYPFVGQLIKPRGTVGPAALQLEVPALRVTPSGPVSAQTRFFTSSCPGVYDEMRPIGCPQGPVPDLPFFQSATSPSVTETLPEFENRPLSGSMRALP